MNSATDLSATTSHPTSVQTSQPSRNAVYLWVGLALFGLALIGGVAASGAYYANIIDAPYVGP